MTHPRLTPARDDLAARHLEGQVKAPRYADPMRMTVIAPLVPLYRRPGTGLDTQLLLGEGFDVYDQADDHAWGQSVLDGYVGYVHIGALTRDAPEPTHRIAALRSHVYPAPDMKTEPTTSLPCGARIAVTGTDEKFARLGEHQYVPVPHLVPLGQAAPDWVAEAERYLGIPYLWGGRSSEGIDCSALIQLSMQAAGLDCPRDSDMQEADLGATLHPDAPLIRGDLLFWKGHVGVMLDGERLLHANAFHMAVGIEPVAEAIPRIEAQGDGPVTRRARLDRDASAL